MPELTFFESSQYGTPAVAIPEGPWASEAIEMAEDLGAFVFEGPDEKVYVVKLHDRPTECYSAGALRRSIGARYTRKTTKEGLLVSFVSYDSEVPEEPVNQIGYDAPTRPLMLSTAPIRVGNKIVTAIGVQAYRETV